jgi:septum site-determining protein MinC
VEHVDPVQAAELSEPFRLRSGAFTIQVLALSDVIQPDFFPWLERKVEMTPHFLEHAPIVLDLGNTPDGTVFDFAAIVRSLRKLRLHLIGVQNGSDQQNEDAGAAGLAILPVWRSGLPTGGGGRKTGNGAAPPPPAATPDNTDVLAALAPKVGGNETAHEPNEPIEAAEPTEGAAAPAQAAQLVTEPVRSGALVEAKGDLVILNTVSPGAEVRAGGHIHVYGALRGRAYAGAAGDRTARIFARQFEPELVSVAGLWRVREDMADEVIGHGAQVRLEGEALTIVPDD